MKRLLVPGIIVVSILVVLGLLTYGGMRAYEYISNPPTDQVLSSDTIEALTNVERVYLDLADEIERGDITAIKAELEKKIAEAEHDMERGLLRLSLAQVIISSDLQAGISHYKAVAADETAPSPLRVAAFIALTSLYYSGGIDATTLDSLIFTDEEPYASLRPTDQSEDARALAYAGILLYADEIHQTLIVNAYLAHYYAEKVFLNPTNESYLTDATFRLRITNHYLENTVDTTFDSSYFAAKVLAGTANLYISAIQLLDTTQSITQIEEGFAGTSAVAEASLKAASEFQGSNEAAKEASRIGFLQNEAMLWDRVLAAAVLVAERHPETPAKIGTLYANHISTPEGAYEKARALDSNSVIFASVQKLTEYSEALRNSLSL